MLSLYIHVPFCVSKCRYCGFYSTTYSSGSIDVFMDGLRHEAALLRHDFSHRSFSSIYIGGGTPSVLSPEQFAQLAGIIRGSLTIDDGAEFTVEANPNTVTYEKLSLMRSQGVNRLSLGMQSFSNEVLRILGRLNTAEQAVDAFRMARTAGFENIGVDLIYGIPGQTAVHWEDTLDSTIALTPEHISAYSLSLDEGSLLTREADSGQFALPDEEICEAMYRRAVIKLHSTGYGRYEISNFSLPGYECRHNMHYWERGEYLGLGPGAWSFISGRRYANIADTSEYVRTLSGGRLPIEVQETVGRCTSAREVVLLRLRTRKGLDLFGFEQEFGADLVRRLKMQVAPLRDAGLLRVKHGRITLTDRGILLSDDALARLSV